MALFIVFWIMIIFLAYAWPIINGRDKTSKVSLCYCFQSSYYKDKRAKKNRLNRIRFDTVETQEALLDQNDLSLSPDEEAENGRLTLTDKEQKLVESGDLEMPNFSDALLKQPNFLRDTLKIDNLVKEFTKEENGIKEKFNAVDGLSLSMFKNQVLVLLGHNGAGKTTTIQMITGLMQPTSGQAKVYGMDVFNERESIDQLIGICPQKNILIGKMTVRENIKFFCTIRGMSDEEI